MARATTVELGGVRLPVATPEDLVIFKAIAWRDIDGSDIAELLIRHHAGMSLERIRGTLTLFYEVLEIPERMVEFDRLVSRALTHRVTASVGRGRNVHRRPGPLRPGLAAQSDEATTSA